MKETFVLKEEDMGGLAVKVVEHLLNKGGDRAKVVHLGGDLGAGKTTFAKELAEVLGIEKEEVNSPTFILKKEYKSNHSYFRRLVHIDAYRFATPEEGKVLRLESDMKDADTVIAIEWPGKMDMENPDVEIHFTVVDDDTRQITLIHD